MDFPPWFHLERLDKFIFLVVGGHVGYHNGETPLPRVVAVVMMRFALLAALAVLLAGCATPSADDAAEAPAATEEGASAPAATPAIDDGTARMDADVGHQPHIHDYWQGRERVTLFQGEVAPNSTGDAFAATTFTALFAREARVGGQPWLLPDGQIVFEGTGGLEITATPVDPTTTSLSLSYKHANTPDFTEPMPLPSGSPVWIEVTPEMADMPHSATSRWAFFFQPEAPGVMLGAFELRVDIVKMHDVDLFPGHPDLWEGLAERVVMDGHHRTEKAAYATRGLYLMENGDFGEPEFAPQRTIPMETTRIVVDVTITGSEATAGEVTQARFFFRGADSSQLQSGGAPVEGTFESGRLKWEIPVEMEMTDSPYANESQWRFMVEPATQFTGADPTCGGCVDSALEFDVVITAYRE